MKIAEVRDEIAVTVSSLFASHGFDVKKTSQAVVCVRKISGGKQEIEFVLHNYRPLYKISVMVCCRFDEMVNISNEICETDSRYHADALSSITKLDYFSGIKNQRCDVTTPEEIQNAINSLRPVLLEKVVPLLDRCLDFRTFEAILNSRSSPKFDFTYLPVAVVNSLIAAHLTGNQEFENLVIEAKHSLKEFSDENKQLLVKCVEYLRKYDSAKKNIGAN
ncbi:hypothetical protein [Solimicrobium silvestre]|uniref:Uncharacterized protein n=1 Tax=Solimicrobium silvestre TaxID=2099400 RepID=A0A2S9H1M8_9BURK|nr:hypothetical protein [Solimicrobium silvestre]PRC93895.1 hypothetical protein S2091_1504 [Solimicrobium silvestre]